MVRVRRNAAIYYALQGLAVVVWWATLFVAPETRTYFQLDAESATSLMAFFVPDIIFLGIGSFAASFLDFRKHRYATAAMWLVTGAISYASLYTLSVVFVTDHGWLGIALMLPAMLWSGVFATGVSVGNHMFRRAKPSSVNYIVLKT